MSIAHLPAVLALSLALPLASPQVLEPGLCPAPPAQMQAARLQAYGGAEQLRVEQVPVPQPGAGDVLVQVHAASINPIDWKQREGLVQSWWPLDLPATLGRDAAGTVVAVGAGATGFACGDAVVLLTPSDRGSFAEYIALPATQVAPKPASLDFVQAAAYPLVGHTAWRALVDSAGIQPGERVLVHGGAGGVGSMAIQIAKSRGAHVITTASARNHDYVRSLGADEAIDYRNIAFEDVVREVDVVFDAVGGDTLARSPKVLRRGGRLVTVAGRIAPEACAAAGIECPALRQTPVREALDGLAELIAAGQLRVYVEAEFALAELPQALERNREGRTRGKLVVRIGADALAAR